MTDLENKTPQNNIVRVEDPEIEALRHRISKKKERVGVLRNELENTLKSLEKFSIQVNQVIAPLERRAAELKEKLQAALHFQKYAYRKEFPQEAWEKAQQKAEEQEQKFHFEKEGKPSLSPEQKRKIKSLFRSLAKRFHPDLAESEEDKTWREETMAKVNLAYQEQNVTELTRLSNLPDKVKGEGSLSREELIGKLQKESDYLDDVISDLEEQIKELDYSLAMQIKLEKNISRQNGRDLLSDVARKLEEEIALLEEELSILGAPVDIDLSNFQ